MKNIYFLLITLFTFTFSSAQIVNIPDSNFKNALLNHTNPIVDLNGDGEIQVSEAQSTWYLYLTNENISSLVGIEYFINLRGLYCIGNQIEVLDMTNSPNLEVLWCQDNQITNLDITNCPELEDLNCSINLLTSLNVLFNPNIRELRCSRNQITNLDVTQITELDILACADNNLISLLTGNINLESIGCHNNQLTNIDVSQNLNLERFWCSNNQLTSLDVSTNLLLETLWCDNNQIVNLDVSQNSSLRSIRCRENQLMNLNIQNGINSVFFHMLSTGNPDLTCIQVDDVDYSNSQVCFNDDDWCKDPWTEYSEDCLLGVEDYKQNSIVIFPNPVWNILNIESQVLIETARIYNIQGQLINEVSSNSLDVSQLTSGLYFVQVTVDGMTETKRFIKE